MACQFGRPSRSFLACALLICAGFGLVAAENRCGTSWATANSSCGSKCPGGLDEECPSGQQCYGDLSSCTSTSTPIASSPPSSSGGKTCSKKKVRIYKFCINGDDDAGGSGEHQIRLDGKKYYPGGDSNCPESPAGYCEWLEGQCHNLSGSKYVTVDRARSLTVGTEEHDNIENDSYSAVLEASKWHDPTCESYEVIIAKPFEVEKTSSVCWNVGAGASAGSGVEVEVSGGVEVCTEWTAPAESYIWLLDVKPA